MFQRLRREDNGVALIMVIMTMMVLTGVVTGTLWYALQTQKGSRHDQDWNGALTAAQAGVDDYLSRLNKVDTYWLTPDCSNVALKKPGVCSATAVGWLPVTGSTVASFHYDADTSQTYSSGTIKLTSTGKVNGVKRSVATALRKTGFGEFLYYTDFETLDPATESVYGFNNTAAQTYCSRHFYDVPTRGSNSGSTENQNFTCQDINFVGGDVLNGPVHSNDAMLMLHINGASPKTDPWFQGPVTTAYPQCQQSPPQSKCYRPNGTVAPNFDKGIAFRANLPFPATIGALKPYTDAAVTANPGCLYTGPTRIKFQSDGTMKVWSRYSKTLNTGCGNPASNWPQTVNVPANNLIYVQGIPASQTSPLPANGPCTAKTIDSTSLGTAGSPLQNGEIPITNDYNNTYDEANCRYGTVYVEGMLKGRVTIAADNNVVITDDLTYQGDKGGTDSLGLIASNFVKVFHPISCSSIAADNTCNSGSNLSRADGTKFQDPSIMAAMLSLKHSFTVQTYDIGSPLGQLSIFGTIGQLYRGPVGTTSGGAPNSGYLKNYSWDSRLKYAPPPFFLDPVGASWGTKTFGEIKAAY